MGQKVYSRARSLPAALLACALAALTLPLAASAVFDPQLVSTFAGNGSNGLSGDGGPATAATLDGPGSISRAPGGGHLIADAHNDVIRHVDEGGKITTVAGTGQKGFNGDALPATSARLAEPEGVAPSPSGGFLIADTRNDRIREVLPGLGVITTVAGTGANGSAGDGLAASLAELNAPTAISPTLDGGFLIADSGNNKIRKVSALGLITTVAGTGVIGSAGDGGPATAAELKGPYDVVATDDGGFLIADTGNNRIRRVAPDGTITTVAGTGTPGFSGDGGDPVAAELYGPEGLDANSYDEFLIADSQNHRVRKVKNGTIKTSVGDGANGFGGDGGDPEAASLNWPVDVLMDGNATFVVDHDNHRVRMVGTLPGAGASDPPVSLPPVDAGLGDQGALPAPEPPQVGEHLNAEPHKGTVRVKLPGDDWLNLPESASIPFGSLIDATKGSVTLTSARDANGATQSATFSGATFKVGQERGARPVTELALRGGDFRRCWQRPAARRSGHVMASARRRHVRRLWGSGKGRFRTRGRHGAATVRGTIWMTEDSCAGTLVGVRRGKVAVRSFATGRTVLVRAGRSFLAPWRAQAARRR